MLSPASWTGNKSRGHLEYSAWYWPMLSLHVKSTTWKISVGLSEFPVCSSLPWLVINRHPFVRVRILKGNHADLWLRGSWLRCYSHVDVSVLRFALFASVCGAAAALMSLFCVLLCLLLCHVRVCLAMPHSLQDISFPTRDWTWAPAVKVLTARENH